MTATDDRLHAAAQHAARMLDLPHPPSAEELADLYASDERAADQLRVARQPVTVRCSVCGGSGRVQMGALPWPLPAEGMER